MIAKNILITGCNRGLGYETVKQLVESSVKPSLIVATCRYPSNAEELNKLAKLHSCIVVAKLDVANEEQYTPLVKNVEQLVGEDGLNLLINNAGVSPKFTRIGLVKWDQMVDTLLINTVAPLMLAKVCLPLLQVAAKKFKEKEMSASRAAIINISSSLGSISENQKGGLYPYRCSKAALNAITKSQSLDLYNYGVLAISMHPGWVKTSMGGPSALLSPEESISKMLQTIWKLGEKENGKFIQYDGSLLPL